MFNNVDLNSGSLKILPIYASNNVAISILYGASTNPLLTRLHISIDFSTDLSTPSSYAMSHNFLFSHLHIVKQSIKRIICYLYIACVADTIASASMVYAFALAVFIMISSEDSLSSFSPSEYMIHVNKGLMYRSTMNPLLVRETVYSSEAATSKSLRINSLTALGISSTLTRMPRSADT